jgi:hypothetical protein
MTRKTLICCAILSLTVACGSSAGQGAESKPIMPEKGVISAKLVAKRTHAPRRERAPREAWHAGDSFVHRFGGSFRQHPLTLTEKVVEVDGDYATMELTLRDEKTEQRLRIKTSFAADANEGQLEEQTETCLLGGKEISCHVTKYRVAINGKPAILTISKSDQVPGRDLGGSIVDEAGKVVYRAELVEMNRGTPQGVAQRE